jgi:hypothetical protein
VPEDDVDAGRRDVKGMSMPTLHAAAPFADRVRSGAREDASTPRPTSPGTPQALRPGLCAGRRRRLSPPPDHCHGHRAAVYRTLSSRDNEGAPFATSEIARLASPLLVCIRLANARAVPVRPRHQPCRSLRGKGGA